MNERALRLFEARCIADIDRILERFEENGIKKCEPPAGKKYVRIFKYFADTPLCGLEDRDQ